MLCLALVAALTFGLSPPVTSGNLTADYPQACTASLSSQMRYLPSDPFTLQECACDVAVIERYSQDKEPTDLPDGQQRVPEACLTNVGG